MINFLKIQNFKSLRNVQFDFRNLNLLMGLNSMGKSSVIQSLLILRQSYIKENSLYKLYTNGDLIKLGNSKDIFFQNAATDEPICFEIEKKKKKIHVKYNFKNTEFDSMIGMIMLNDILNIGLREFKDVDISKINTKKEGYIDCYINSFNVSKINDKNGVSYTLKR